jgi:type IV secretory pathway TraG/TraD family ATPase VirD4
MHGSLSGSLNLGHSDSISFSEGTSDSYGDSASRTASYSESIQKRPLATPDEVDRIFSNETTPEGLLLISGYQPLKFISTPYYSELAITGMFDPHPSHLPPPTLDERQRQWREAFWAEVHRSTDAELRR